MKNQYIIGPAQISELIEWAERNKAWLNKTTCHAENILSGEIKIFGINYSFQDPACKLPWHTDWRYDHTWTPSFYQTYKFYEREKDEPYDVKFPWELSRLSFLIPVAELAAIQSEEKWCKFCMDVIKNWERENPYAHSVSWYGMECSIRAINLGFILLLITANRNIDPDVLEPILRQLVLHGDFIYKNLEYSDVRGNHYTANIVSLIFIGHLIKDLYNPAKTWFEYGKEGFDEEVLSQYLPDGVNFEKSFPYHRLVTELFLIGCYVLEKEGQSISENVKSRLYYACQFVDSYLRPDGFAPNIGDNDSARVLNFDPVQIRDHRPLLVLASSYFNEHEHLSRVEIPSAARPLFSDLRNADLQVDYTSWISLGNYEEGGYYISKSRKDYFCADFGEVGFAGRGGHGHNDTFSFVLMFDKIPVVVDPGSPCYSGDLEKHKRYRSTEFHNTLRIDRKEMARILGRWRISNEAQPKNVSYIDENSYKTVSGVHHGYRRLPDPSVHSRTFICDMKRGYVKCEDIIFCKDEHFVERFLHFDSGIKPVLNYEGSTLDLFVEDRHLGKIIWDQFAEPRLETYYVSYNYGQEIPAKKLILECRYTNKQELSFEIIKHGERA